MTDKEFLAKANEKIKAETDNEQFMISSENRPHVILGIISESEAERPKLSFFSKVALCYVKRRLTGIIVI